MVILMFFIDLLMLIFAVISCVGNGIIFILFRTPSLRNNDGLFLITMLAFADFLLAFSNLPLSVVLLSELRENATYSTNQMIMFSLPLVAEIKLNSILLLAIAWDRFTAVRWPSGYKLINKKKCSLASFILGAAWAVCDAIFFLSNAIFEQQSSCTAAGCLMNASFRLYWAFSNALIITASLVMVFLVLIKSRAMRVVQPADMFFTESDFDLDNFLNANQIAVAVVISAFLCIALPSCFMGVGDLLVVDLFRSVSNYVTLGLLLCGVVNAFIIGMKHHTLRNVLDLLRVRTRTVSRTGSDAGLRMPTITVSRPLSDIEPGLHLPTIVITQNREEQQHFHQIISGLSEPSSYLAVQPTFKNLGLEPSPYIDAQRRERGPI